MIVYSSFFRRRGDETVYFSGTRRRAEKVYAYFNSNLSIFVVNQGGNNSRCYN